VINGDSWFGRSQKRANIGVDFYLVEGFPIGFGLFSFVAAVVSGAYFTDGTEAICASLILIKTIFRL
jgi:hypothetical protein